MCLSGNRSRLDFRLALVAAERDLVVEPVQSMLRQFDWLVLNVEHSVDSDWNRSPCFVVFGFLGRIGIKRYRHRISICDAKEISIANCKIPRPYVTRPAIAKWQLQRQPLPLLTADSIIAIATQ